MEDKFKIKSQNWDNLTKVKMTANFVKEVKKRHMLSPEKKVIEFGCGTGLVGLQIAPSVSHITMIDNSPSMLVQLNEKIGIAHLQNISIIQGELSDYTLSPADAIIGFMVLHHIHDTVQLLKDAYHQLNENGILIIGDLHEEDGTFHGKESVPHNGFNTDELLTCASKHGFRHIEVKTYDSVTKHDKNFPIFILIAHK